MNLAHAVVAKNTKNVTVMFNSPGELMTKPSLFEKIAFTLGGFLIGMLSIVAFLKITSNYWGILIAIAINIAISYYLFKKKSTETDKKLLAYGIIASICVTIIAGILLWGIVSIMFQGIAG